VLGVLADDANHASAMNYLALVTDLLDGRTNLHEKIPSKSMTCAWKRPGEDHNV
jgi:hypothetical protein